MSGRRTSTRGRGGATTTWKPKPIPFRFTSLPPEMQCEVLSFPMTLTQFKQYQNVSKEFQRIILSCVREINSNLVEEGSIPISTILNMSNIQTIGIEYPVVVTSIGELMALANHPTLKEVNFDVGRLVRDDKTKIYSLIVDFFNEYNKHKLLPASCNDCNYTYHFTFSFSGKKVKFDDEYIFVSNGKLILNEAPDISDEEYLDFLTNLSYKVPICYWRGTLNSNATQLSSLPCINEVYFYFDPGFVVKTFIGNIVSGESRGIYNVLTPLLDIETLTEYSINYGEQITSDPDFEESDPFDDYSQAIHTFVQQLGKDNISYPHVKKFFPVVWNDVALLLKIMPNLEEIEITLYSLQTLYRGVIGNGDPRNFNPFGAGRDYLKFLSAIMDHQKIIIRADVEGGSNTNVAYLFPQEVWPRLTYTL